MVTNSERIFVSTAALRKLISLIKQDENQFRDVTKTVDRDALLALADDIEHEGDDVSYKLRKMGVLDDSFAAFARRIREACGVE